MPLQEEVRLDDLLESLRGILQLAKNGVLQVVPAKENQDILISHFF